MKRFIISLVASVVGASLLVAGCAPAAPALTPTSVPAKAAEPTKPAAAAAAPTKPAEPTKPAAAAPTKAVEPTRPAAPAPTKAAEPTKPAAAAPAKKIDFPEKGKTATFIVPYAAGSASDVAGRLLGAALEKEMGISFQVSNKPGASSQVGVTELVKSKPDGYTIGIAALATIISYLDPERQAAYKGEDLALIALFASQPNIWTVRSDSPFKTAKDLVDAAKANPGQIKVGTSGLKGTPHLGGLAFQQAAGVKLAYVHFDGDAGSLTALLGGHVDVTVGGSPPVLPQVQSGAARVLAIMDKEPARMLPGVKTLEEQGYKVHAPGVYYISAPTGTSRDILETLSAAIKSAMDTEDLKKKLDETGMRPSYQNPVQARASWNEWESWAKPLVELAGKQ